MHKDREFFAISDHDLIEKIRNTRKESDPIRFAKLRIEYADRIREVTPFDPKRYLKGLGIICVGYTFIIVTGMEKHQHRFSPPDNPLPELLRFYGIVICVSILCFAVNYAYKSWIARDVDAHRQKSVNGFKIESFDYRYSFTHSERHEVIRLIDDKIHPELCEKLLNSGVEQVDKRFINVVGVVLILLFVIAIAFFKDY